MILIADEDHRLLKEVVSALGANPSVSMINIAETKVRRVLTNIDLLMQEKAHPIAMIVEK